MKTNIIKRLKIIRGQIDGLINAIEDNNNDCQGIMNQVKATKNAFQSLGGEVMKKYIYQCLVSEKNKIQREKKLEELLNTFIKF